MENSKFNERSQRIADLLKRNGFERVNNTTKADEFRYSQGQYLYFYWPNIKGLNFVIHPGLNYDQLIKIVGVKLQKTPKGEGLRAGSA